MVCHITVLRWTLDKLYTTALACAAATVTAKVRKGNFAHVHTTTLVQHCVAYMLLFHKQEVSLSAPHHAWQIEKAQFPQTSLSHKPAVQPGSRGSVSSSCSKVNYRYSGTHMR